MLNDEFVRACWE